MITDVYTCEPVGGPKHYQVTVRDGAGTVIGTTATGVPFPEVADRQDNICTWTGSYEVEVPREDFYLFHVEGTDKDPEPISYKDLVAMNFEYDLTLGPA